ncbi:phospholipid transfer protein-like protein [Lates japonicus]|uniref:Phospholipid transfer protein-like protein n=1 Tax=Lates japonicus TaxID=270547 RepID=A0AAD3NBN9_LATJO|nr:phospholipid transfer protein-like protein [Lates japonicus]
MPALPRPANPHAHTNTHNTPLLPTCHQPLPAPFNVELTEAATAKITRDGLIVTVKANARSQKEPTKPPFPLNCQVDLKIGVKDKSLVSLSHNVKCNSDTVKGKFVSGLGNIIISFLNWYYGGILMPLPEGLDFSQGEIEYYDGYLVIGGDLSMTQAAREKMMRRTGS